MIVAQETYKQIEALRKSGLRMWDVAERLGMRRSRAAGIVAEVRQAATARRLTRSARAEIRAANDIDRPWPVETILAALSLPGKGHGRLDDYLRREGRTTASLREVMDFMLPDVNAPVTDIWRAMPALRHRQLGGRIYVYLVGALCHTNLGMAFRREWTARRRRAVQLMGHPTWPSGICCVLRCGIVPSRCG